MLALIQRVRRASVTIDGAVVGAIGPGLLVLVCAEQGDTPAQAEKLLAKILKLRIFSDAQGKMNRCVQDLDGAGLHGGLLVVSQFTRLGARALRLFCAASPRAAQRCANRRICCRYASRVG